MPVERLRMRPWLENILNTGKYPGVEWLDKEKKIFRLPWKHASRNGWKMQTDACLFRAWAVHTGKYKDTERPNPKIWKANFRCALNSLPDMEEMLDRRSTKGSDAFKVYKIITRLPNSEMRKPLKKYKGRYQRKKRMITRSTSDQKESKPKTANNELMEEEGEQVQLESVEVTSHTFSVPQACVRRHLVDHDYAMTRYFDIFDEQNPEAMVRVFNAPDPTIVKTEPPSPNETMPEEYSFYEDENGNVSKNFDSSKEADEKVMSDDEVIELIDELSSECDSSADSVDAAMEEFIEGCMDSIENDFKRPSKERSNSAPGLLESSFDSLSVFPTTTLVKSKSVPDVKTMLSTSPQELLQSCLS